MTWRFACPTYHCFSKAVLSVSKSWQPASDPCEDESISIHSSLEGCVAFLWKNFQILGSQSYRVEFILFSQMQKSLGVILSRIVAIGTVQQKRLQWRWYLCMCANVSKGTINEMFFGVLNLISRWKLWIGMIHEGCQQRASQMEEMELKQEKASATYIILRPY